MRSRLIATTIATIIALGSVCSAEPRPDPPAPTDFRVSKVDSNSRPLLLILFSSIRDSEDKGGTPSFVVVSKVKEGEYLCRQEVKRATYSDAGKDPFGGGGGDPFGGGGGGRSAYSPFVSDARASNDPFGGGGSKVNPGTTIVNEVDSSRVFLVKVPDEPDEEGDDKRDAVAKAIDSKIEAEDSLKAGSHLPKARYEMQPEKYEYTTSGGVKRKVSVYSAVSAGQLTQERFIERLKAGEVFMICPSARTHRCQNCSGFGRVLAKGKNKGKDGKVVCPHCGGHGKGRVLYKVRW